MSVLDDLEFIFFHLMPYAPLPDGYKEADSLWVDYPNSNFDPVTGHELYKRYWSELLLADKLVKLVPPTLPPLPPFEIVEG